MSDKGSLIANDDIKKIIALDNLVRQGKSEMALAEDAGNQTVKAFVQARMLAILREQMVGGLMKDVMKLAGTPLGFLTDRDHSAKLGPYKEAVVKDAVIEALIRGYRLVGNEFNIIAGKFYPAKTGVQRLLSDVEGFTDLKLEIGVPAASGKRWLVPGRASWKMFGVADLIDRSEGDWRLILPLYDSDKPETVAGKAESRLLRLVYKRCTGSQMSIAEDMVTTASGEAVDSETVIEGEVVEHDEPSLPAAITPEFVDSEIAKCERKTQVVERGDELKKRAEGEEMVDYIFEAVERRCADLMSLAQPANA